MKTDRFTDIIRRKLESIRPEFTDKDWARMHSTLKDANVSPPNLPNANGPFSGGIWSGQSWLLAAAAISTVVLVAFSIWQRREINNLRQTIGQLHSQPANPSALTPSNPGVAQQVRPDVAQSSGVAPSKRTQETITSANRNESQAVRPDTVYVTRYVAAPSRNKPDVDDKKRLSQQVETPLQQRYATENRVSSPATTRQPITPTHNQQTELHDASSTPPSVAKNTTNESTVPNKLTKPSGQDKGSIDQNTSGRDTKGSAKSPLNPADNPKTIAVSNTPVQTDSPAAVNGISATYELASSLPFSMESRSWGAALAQRANRMQATQPVRSAPAAEQAKAPASQAQRAGLRFRAGIGGEVASRLWSAGVFTEVLIGRHWTVGVGLSQATHLDKFITDDDFNNRTKRDFRKEFGRGIEPWRDILNIDTRQVRFQLPLSIGYRIPLTRTLTFLPAVGTYLNLTNAENVTYYCRPSQRPFMQPQPQRGFDEFSTSKTQPVDLINSLSLGAGIEWQRGHWVVQATPILTIPAQTGVQAMQPDLNSQKNTTLGLRARLLYQF